MVSSILGITPFESPDVGLVIALERAGALGVLDLGHDFRAARTALATLAQRMPRGFGVRLGSHAPLGLDALPPSARVVVIDAAASHAHLSKGRGANARCIVMQVTSVDEARAAIAIGADGLIVKGHEAAGRVGSETAFVLLQRIARITTLPLWVQGGIGIHTAAGSIAGGAYGVVLDSQLALLREASTSSALRRAVAAMDGSETAVAAEHRVFSRPSAFPPPPGATASTLGKSFRAGDPARELIALGQDASFALTFAQRFESVAPLIRALRDAMTHDVRVACNANALGEGGPLATAHATRYPIVQGPMTRVSDRASFARDVADAGGLPFIALSLMRGEEARALLRDTKAALAGASWGVGVLGFLPPEIRDEQLALLAEARPPFALIAGGRPSQARPLENAGIATYLHVPSPGLLDLFLADGARRFVFEGRECGGHVGPRSSFVLWEAAVERLLAMTDAELRDVSVLFAGGIQDGRSAAIVSAIAAPLVARGAKIGVLMGTAYLFTEEAVASGAIAPAFQAAAISCDRTELLETAPGHATRCADSDYVRAFARERARLATSGADAQTIWTSLEQMNLGRLRVAAKGLRRDGDAIVSVDDEEQRREGLFMIGQAVALRDARCTIASLHRDVSEGSRECLALAAPEERVPARHAEPADVAIIGIACIFPDAPDLATFWDNIVAGRDAIREVPEERWSAAIYFDPAGGADKTPSKWGGFVPPIVFEPAAYGIPPRSLAAIDPVQLLALEVAARALRDAGYERRAFDRSRASVVFGAESGTDLASAYGFRAMYPQTMGPIPPELDHHLPKLTEDSFPGLLANVIAGRIANRLDLGGVNYTVDAACASSFAALDVACKELAIGSSDMVIAGGADLHNSINDYLLFASVHALSPSGKCRTFDASADGIALGEGVAAVVLKRLADAERDGDRVYAVIKGIGGSSDGKSLGLTAPRREGQVRALERAYAHAGIAPADVGLVEAHGTGTVVGDKTELAALTEFFARGGAERGACTLGSVKSQIGHTKCAAGMAGLIKAALALHHRVLPPTLNVQTPNAAYDANESAFVFRDAAAPWASERRAAGVSAFGFGGTNFHVVLESHADEVTPAAGQDAWPAELFVIRGVDRAAAMRTLAQVDAVMTNEGGQRLRDVARSAAAAGGDAPVQIAIVAESAADLNGKIAAARAGETREGVYVADDAARFDASEVAFLFPGQGSQRPGMLAELFVAFPELHDLVRLGDRWEKNIFPAARFTAEARGKDKRALTDTRVAQPALGIVDLAMARLLDRVGVRPAMVAGHSYGELVALSVAGAFGAETLLALSETRAKHIVAAAGDSPGTMAAVRASVESIRDALGADADSIAFANMNALDQTVIAGSSLAIDAACARLEARGLRAKAIPVSCAFHSPIVAAASDAFAEALRDVAIAPMTIPVFGNQDARAYATDPDAVRATLAAQLASPVRFRDQIEAMYAAGARVFVESGPGAVLTDLVGRILAGRPHLAVACDTGGPRAIASWLTALARLATAGVDVDAAQLFEGRDARAFDLASPPSAAPSATAWLVDGHRARPLHGDLPDFAMHPLTAPLAIAPPPRIVGDREGAVLEYLRATRELIEGQRQVMLRYLGQSSAADLEARTVVPASVSARVKTNGVQHAEKARSGEGASVHARALPKAAEVTGTPLEILVATVSARTGYPPEMLDVDLDLEADLGIDSIKRIEILGTLGQRLGMKLSQDDASLEVVATIKTLRGIATWIEGRLAPPPISTNAAAPAPLAVSVARTLHDSEPPPSSGSIMRYVVAVDAVPAAVPNGVTVAGRTFAILGDRHGVAKELALLLQSFGARTQFLAPGEALPIVDGLLHLDSMSADSPSSLKSLFELTKSAILGDTKWIVAATGLGGGFGRDAELGAVAARFGGVAGLLKSVAKESPERRVRAIDLRCGEDPCELARNIYAEIVASDAHVEIGYARGERRVLRVVAGAIDAPRDPHARAIELDAHSVVLVTGGGRGITARVAIEMARRYQCRIEIVGRTALPAVDDEDRELEGATDEASLRALLLARAHGAGPTTPAAIDAHCRRVLAVCEIRATLAAIRAAGGTCEYHATDVRDAGAFGALIDALYARHGRLDGVVHGAGLVEDKLVKSKTRESFDRVFDTKMASALTLADKLRGDTRFVVFFSSVSAFGNRGQADYAAANAALDVLAHHLADKLAAHARVLSINWGPWRGVGMVRPELEREYARRGVELIAPEDGVARFFDELLHRKDSQVIVMASSPEALA